MAESGSAAGQTPSGLPHKRRRLSWIWLVPIVAAVGGLLLVLQVWLSAGPTAVIHFQTAEGLEAGKTQVRYKEVTVGLVERVALNRQRRHRVLGGQAPPDAKRRVRAGHVAVGFVYRPGSGGKPWQGRRKSEESV
ncbi:hypothetical protein G6F32_014315 [Rhizopus arrhizus]|nr:hypothetical protein G6F32_014315 [Rhizopus arrhizus]